MTRRFWKSWAKPRFGASVFGILLAAKKAFAVFLFAIPFSYWVGTAGIAALGGAAMTIWSEPAGNRAPRRVAEPFSSWGTPPPTVLIDEPQPKRVGFTRSVDMMPIWPTQPPAPTSSRTCKYPPGYPRLPAPSPEQVEGATDSVRHLIIREINSRQGAPLPADLAKWSTDAGMRLELTAGPVLGTYEVAFGQGALSPVQASQVIQRMYENDVRFGNCSYDFIDIGDGRTSTQTLPGATQLKWIPGSLVIDPGAPRDVFHYAREDLANGFITGAWQTLAKRLLDPAAKPSTPVAITVLDTGFYSASEDGAGSRTSYLKATAGPAYFMSQKGLSTQGFKGCSTLPKMADAGACHGEHVAAVIAQPAAYYFPATGDYAMPDGSGFLYQRANFLSGMLGHDVGVTVGDSIVPITRPDGKSLFPLYKVQSAGGFGLSGDVLVNAAAMLYSAGLPVYTKTQQNGSVLLNTESGDPLPTLNPAPRVVVTSTDSQTDWAYCDTEPLYRDVLDALDKKNVIVVAAAGNIDYYQSAWSTDLRAEKAHAVEVQRRAAFPVGCSGVINAAGWDFKSSEGLDRILSPGSIAGAPGWSIAGPMSLNVYFRDDAGRVVPVRDEGTSIVSPQVGAVVAMMLSIEPDLDKYQILDILLRSGQTTADSAALQILDAGKALQDVVVHDYPSKSQAWQLHQPQEPPEVKNKAPYRVFRTSDQRPRPLGGNLPR